MPLEDYRGGKVTSVNNESTKIYGKDFIMCDGMPKFDCLLYVMD